MVEVLLKYGANINATRTKSPSTALSICGKYSFIFIIIRIDDPAVAKHHNDLANFLVTRGAKEIALQTAQASSSSLQVMTFTDKIPPKFEYKKISLLERQALSKVHLLFFSISFFFSWILPYAQQQQASPVTSTANIATDYSSSFQQRQWKTVRIFISSSFKDMHAERTYIVNTLMAKLRKQCAERKVHVLEVDLRWGITEEDAQTGKVLELCLEEINRCNVSSKK